MIEGSFKRALLAGMLLAEIKFFIPRLNNGTIKKYIYSLGDIYSLSCIRMPNCSR